MKMQSKKQSKKFYKKSFTLAYRILLRIKKGMYQEQIARQLKLPTQNIYYHIRKLEKKGYIKSILRTSSKIYTITEEGKEFLKSIKQSKKFSLSVKEKNTRLHNLSIKFPILKDNPHATFDRKTSINNWVKKYTTITFPVGITIEKTPRHVIAHFHQFQTRQKRFATDFFTHVFRGVNYVYYYLIKQKRIKIDPYNATIIRQHIAVESPEYNGKIPSNRTAELNLKRSASSVLPTNFMAKAWLDKSLGNVDIETNDFVYEEKLLQMPEIVHEMGDKFIPAITNLTQQINLHLEVQEQQLSAVIQLKKEISDLAKVIKELNKK